MQDAGWGWGPASNGTTLFTGSARSDGCCGGERALVPGNGGAVWGQRCQRGQVVAALAGHRQCRGQADGWAAAAAAEARERLAVGADRRKTGPDPGLRRGRLLRAVVAELAGRGTPARYGAVWRFFAREGISFKKSRHASEQDRLDIARRRARWKMHQGRLDPRRLVFLDETWAKTTMTRRHGRWARGARLVAKLPHRRWRTLTFRAARRHDRSAAPCVIDGPINATSFGAGACPCEGGGRAVPGAHPQPRRHRRHGQSRQPQGQGRAPACFAPPAPSCSSCRAIRPISTQSSTSWRKTDPRTIEATWRSIGALLDRFTPTECGNDLANANYTSA